MRNNRGKVIPSDQRLTGFSEPSAVQSPQAHPSIRCNPGPYEAKGGRVRVCGSIDGESHPISALQSFQSRQLPNLRRHTLQVVGVQIPMRLRERVLQHRFGSGNPISKHPISSHRISRRLIYNLCLTTRSEASTARFPPAHSAGHYHPSAYGV